MRTALLVRPEKESAENSTLRRNPNSERSEIRQPLVLEEFGRVEQEMPNVVDWPNKDVRKVELMSSTHCIEELRETWARNAWVQEEQNMDDLLESPEEYNMVRRVHHLTQELFSRHTKGDLEEQYVNQIVAWKHQYGYDFAEEQAQMRELAENARGHREYKMCRDVYGNVEEILIGSECSSDSEPGGERFTVIEKSVS